MARKRAALITGGGRGIGLACAKRLAAEGVACALLDVHEEFAREAARSLGAGHAGVAADVTDREAVARAFREAEAALGPVNLIVNSAGIAGPTAPAWELDPADVRRVMDVNYMGTFLVCAAAIPSMIRQGWGRIVNIASIAGKEGNPNLSAYSASKGAVIALTKSLGKELATKGVLVNAIAPAVIESEMSRGVSKETFDYMVSKIPMGRLGKPEEVAELVAWLCSDGVSFSTGVCYDISGGRATY
jgi:NAD(P)-dependent dehydrogenase (short-subunit alcohol dehydrogenase family)